jgi:hypothetical protein
MKDELFIERRIVTGLIISTEYITSIRKIWKSILLNSSSAKLIADWCIEFYDQYHTAPAREMESIFLRKSKGIKPSDANDIEDILASLSDDLERQDKFNVQYLIDQTIQYFDERNLREFLEDITADLEEGKILEAKDRAFAYKPSVEIESKDLDLSNSEQLKQAVRKAFQSTSQPLVKYPRQLGEFLNPQLTRGSFIAFMGPEKRGKTWMLMDIAIRGARQGSNVAFFQAGDMTQDQQLKRIAISLTKKSDKEQYSGKMYEPVRDCVLNQTDKCDRKERECNFGPFSGKDEKIIRSETTYGELIEAVKANLDYKPCFNCAEYWKRRWGAAWLKEIDTGEPLTSKHAERNLEKFFVKNKRRFRLSSHTSGALTASEIDRTLDLWEHKDGFVADIIIVDFADIMASEIKGEFRHQENDKWMKLRGVSQKRHALVVTATWTDSNSYETDLLSLKNFSEDKRKYGHVTAMYGLNQDKKGREKEIGIMRINEIVIREDAFLNSNQVHVLQNLKRGQPCLSSFW